MDVRPGVALALVACACVCACVERGEVEPLTPVDSSREDPVCARPAAVEDSFPARFAASEVEDPYRVERPRSIDLGAIGDTPLGQDPPRPRSIPEWQKPFPCHWTNTCPPVVIFRTVAGP